MPTKRGGSTVQTRSKTRVEPPSPISSISSKARRFRSPNKAKVAKKTATVHEEEPCHNNNNNNKNKNKNKSNKSNKKKTSKKKTLFSPAYNPDDDSEPATERPRPKRTTRSRTRGSTKQPEAKANAPREPEPELEPEPQVEAEDDEDLEFCPFMFIKNLPPLEAEMMNRPSPIPKKKRGSPRITLALDLDETLVHCSVEPLENAKLTFNVNFKGDNFKVYVRTRPHLDKFLETVSQWFEVIVFTASQSVYANTLLDILDPNKYIKYRVFRESCVYTPTGCFVKDLHILGRDLKTTAIVDNSVQAFAYQLNNGIPIESWFDDENDSELLTMLDFLEGLKDARDVRPMIRDYFKLEEYINSL